MKLLFFVLPSVFSYYCCAGYPAYGGEISDDILPENGTPTQHRFNSTMEIDFDDSSLQEMHGFFKKVKDKVKGKLNKVKDKVKNKVKDQIKDYKDILNLFAVSFPEETLVENFDSTEMLLHLSDTFLETESDDLSTLEMHGFFKKIKDKIKKELNKVKDKVANQIKKKINDCKNIFKLFAVSFLEETSEDALTENGVSNEFLSPLDASKNNFFNDLPQMKNQVLEKVVDVLKKKLKDKIQEKVKDCIDIFK